MATISSLFTAASGIRFVLAVAWIYLTIRGVNCLRVSRKSYPSFAPVFLAITVGASCGTLVSLNGALAPLWHGSATASVATDLPSFLISTLGNVVAFVFTYLVTLKDWLPRIASEQVAQRSETEELRALVDARTDDLRKANEQLERDIAERRQVEANLRSEHALLDTVMKTSVGAITVLNHDGAIVFANEAARGLLGISEGKAYNAPEWQHTDLEGRPLQDAEQPFRRVMKAGEPIYDMQHCIVSPDGARRTLTINGAPLKEADGSVSGAVFLVSDITQRKHDEELLKNSEKRFRTMVENLPGGAVYLEGEKIFMNRAAERITGYQRSELTTIQQWFWALYAEESRNEREKYDALRKTGFPEPYISEIRLKNGQRRLVECEGYQSENVTIWLLHDVTERYRAEEALRASEHKYRLLAETALDIICIHDLEGKISYANEAGLRLAERLRSADGTFNICRVLTPETRARIDEQRKSRLRGDHSRRLFEAELLTGDGEQVPFEVSSVPIVIDGKLTGILSVARDISERRRAESERAKLEARVHHSKKLESLGQLAGGIANDFNNILMGILGSADLAWQDMPEVSSTRQYMEEIFSSVKRASELCKHLVAYTGQDRYAGGYVDLNALLGDMIRLSRVPFQEGVNLDLKLSESMPGVEGEAPQLGRAILNLLSNACEALDGANGTISISTGTARCTAATFAEAYLESPVPEGTYNFVTVSDTGGGMDEDTVQRMFDPFFSTKAKGRGLGLSDVLGIVRGHGGTVTVASRLGGGTTITMYFPAAQSKVESQGHDLSVTWQGSGTVLVVDDEENVLSVTRRMLTRLGFKSVTATTGEEALEIAGQSPQALRVVILDLALPDMDSETAIEGIRGLLPTTPIVVTSGYSLKSVSDLLATHNVSGFLPKPFHIHDLARHLQSALEHTS